jgi:hypothetical protein
MRQPDRQTDMVKIMGACLKIFVAMRMLRIAFESPVTGMDLAGHSLQ